MLYHLLFPLAGKFEPFNVFRYQTFRGIKTDYGKWDDFTDAHAVEDHEIAQKAVAEMRRVLGTAARLYCAANLSVETMLDRMEKVFRDAAASVQRSVGAER